MKFHLPTHLRPSPTQPVRHLHLKLPGTLTQDACTSQLCAPISHSSTSKEKINIKHLSSCIFYQYKSIIELIDNSNIKVLHHAIYKLSLLSSPLTQPFTVNSFKDSVTSAIWGKASCQAWSCGQSLTPCRFQPKSHQKYILVMS